MATLVKFRKDKPNQYNPEYYITAVFPQLKHNKRMHGNDRVISYAHNGQHSPCSMQWVNECTEPANESEYQPLLRELESIGYNNLKICK